MKQSSSQRTISLVAVLQVVPFLLFPWRFTFQSLILALVLILLSAFLGWALWQRKPWGRLLSIFAQGFNIVIRLITLFPNVYVPDRGLNWTLLVTYVLSMGISWLLLSYIDKPEVQLVFQS